MVLQQSQTMAGKPSAANSTPTLIMDTPEKALHRHCKGDPGGRPRPKKGKPSVTRKAGVIRPGVWRLSAALCTTCLGFATMALVARALGPDAFGSYMFVCWLATVTIPVVSTGISTLVARQMGEIWAYDTPRIAAGLFQFAWKRQYRRALLYCIVYLLLITPLWWLFRTAAPIAYLFLAGVSALPLLFSGVVGMTLHSIRRYDLLATIRLCSAVATLLLITIAIQVTAGGVNPQGEIGIFLLALAVANTLVLVLALLSVNRLLPMRQAVKPGPFSQARLKKGFRPSPMFFILDAIVWQPAAMLLLVYRHGSGAELGIYALSFIISTCIMNIAPTMFSACLLPFLLRHVRFYRFTNARTAFFKTSLSIALLALPISVCLGLFCPVIIATFLGSAYLPVVLPLRILLISSTLGSISTVSVTHLSKCAEADTLPRRGCRPLRSGEAYRRAQLWLGIGAAFVGIGLGIPCIALWGLVGAAIASAIAQGISALGSMMICTKYMLGTLSAPCLGDR
jgi:O-antigen/teichoic acid export membrane protein